jgi:hypothetical protein
MWRHGEVPHARYRRTRSFLPAFITGLAMLVAGGSVVSVLGLMRSDLPVVAKDMPPALPITVGGVLLNVPSQAIRVPLQRQPGTAERIDLAFGFPDLTIPRLDVTDDLVPREADLLFVTIRLSEGGMVTPERRRDLYPRFLAGDGRTLPEGLAITPFRTGSPFQGEDLVTDMAGGTTFFARCTRPDRSVPGTCFLDKRIGAADITFRFSRDFLPRWREVSDSAERLMASLRPPRA